MSDTPQTDQGGASSAPPLLTKDQIKGNAKFGQAYVMAFGGRLRVIELDGKGRMGVEAFAIRRRKKLAAQGLDDDAVDAEMESGYMGLWLLFCVVDEAGKRVWADEDFDDVCALPGHDLRRVWKIASKLNHLAEPDDEDDSGN